MTCLIVKTLCASLIALTGINNAKYDLCRELFEETRSLHTPFRYEVCHVDRLAIDIDTVLNYLYMRSVYIARNVHSSVVGIPVPENSKL